MDMEEAFDWVNRDLLFYRLLELNIDGQIFNAIKNLYMDNSAFVRLHSNLTTEWFQVPTGVRQGDTLSPTLFCLFINDLADHLKESELGVHVMNEIVSFLFYADDIILLAESEAELQSLLDALNHWCKCWHLKVNSSKTKVMHIRNKRRKLTSFKYIMSNTELEIVTEYKYLGFYLHENLNFDNCANHFVSAGSRALGSVINKFKCLKNATFNSFTKLFNAGITSILDYSSEVWGFTKAEQCDRLQSRAQRFYLGVHKFCPIASLNGDMGWFPSRYRRFLNMARFWNRLIKLKDTRLVKRIFIWDMDQGHSNWSSEIENVFDIGNMNDIYDTKSFCILKQLEINLLAEYQAKWSNQCTSMPKLRTYITFKTVYCTENYVKMYLTRQQRSILAQIRSGILPLRIETGRFQNTKDSTSKKMRKLKPEERTCLICKTDNVEDEMHFIFECEVYCESRNNMFAKAELENDNFTSLNDVEKLEYLMVSECKLLSEYLIDSWNIRKSLMYT